MRKFAARTYIKPNREVQRGRDTKARPLLATALVATLQNARDDAKKLGCKRTLARIRLALSSAKGARRHEINRAVQQGIWP